MLRSFSVRLSCPVSIGGQGREVQTHSEHQGLLACKIRYSHVCHSGWGWAVGPPAGGRHLHLPADVSTDDGLRYRSDMPSVQKNNCTCSTTYSHGRTTKKPCCLQTWVEQENETVFVGPCVWRIAQVFGSSQTWTRLPLFRTWCSTSRLLIKWRWVKSTCFNL